MHTATFCRRLAASLCFLLTAAVAHAQAGAGAQDQIERGKYLATAADCVACHTADPAKPYAGGYRIDTPFGTIYSTNLTPDKDVGIGDWTDDEFARALHEGIGRHGENLYPAMPFDMYTQMSRDDALAIKAYLLTLPPIHQAPPPNALQFPFNQRWVLSVWKLVNFKAQYFVQDAAKPAAWNRGAYLVNALEHCGSCHTPRNLMQGMKSSKELGGSQLGAWQAYNISADPLGGVGGWSDDDLYRYLKTGHAQGKGSAAGPMAEAVENSLSKLNDGDLHAIVTYLRGVAPISDGQSKSRSDFGSAADYEASLRGGKLTNSNADQGGAELFSGACASCHAATGKGTTDGFYPSLFHNSTVGAPDPGNLVSAMVEGVHYRNGSGDILMPAFGSQLDNEQIASIANYVLKQFGQGGSVDARFVQTQRDGGPASSLSTLMWIGVVAVLVVLIFLILWIRRRRRV